MRFKVWKVQRFIQNGQFLRKVIQLNIQINKLLIIKSQTVNQSILCIIIRFKAMSSKSPIRDYTALLQRSRTKKKEDHILLSQKRDYDRYSYIARKLDTSAPSYDDTKMKLQLALKHNTRLLDQNATLSQMANSLRFQLKNAQDDITIIRRQQQQVIRQTGKQRETLSMEIQIKELNHEQQLKKLLDQISTLHQEKNNLEIDKTKQIETMKGQFEKSLLTQMQNLRNVQNNAKQLYEVQIRGLKQSMKKQQFQMQNLKAIQRLQKNRLKDQVTSIENQMKHLRQRYQTDIKQTQRQFEKDVASQRRRLENQRQVQSNSLNLKLKRAKKQILDRAQDLQATTKKLYQMEQTQQLQSMTSKKDKENLLTELNNNEIVYKTTLMKQKTKLEELARLEVDNLTNLYETNIEQLQGQVNRLRLLIDCKTEQIKDSYEENKRIKESYGNEMEMIKSQNDELKKKIHTVELQFRQQQQTTKVKLATLIEANLTSITQYYQHQLSNLAIHNRDLSNLNKDLKDRIYKLIADNDQLRKNFEIQNSKAKARVQDLKIKLASVSLQHKEHIGSLSSKVQMTSQTLIRQSDTKERTRAFYDQQKRKFHALTNQKDQQIAEMMESLKSIKQMHEDELKVVRTERDTFREDNDKLQLDKKRIKENLQQELLSKDEKLRTLKYDNQKQLDEINQLELKLAQAEKQLIKLRKTMDHVNLVNQSLSQQLGLKKGFIESLQLQSNAAIEEEKNKIRVLMGSHQVTLKEYFEDKLKSKNRDIQSLQQRLTEKQDDIRELIVKYNALEKRFDMAMQAQDKLTEFQQKIKQLGLDNNLVKNMAELFQKGKVKK